MHVCICPLVQERTKTLTYTNRHTDGRTGNLLSRRFRLDIKQPCAGTF